MSQVLNLPYPYLLFLGDTTEKGYAKTAFGLRDWARDRCVGEWSCAGATVTTDLPRLTPKEARARGARAHRGAVVVTVQLWMTGSPGSGSPG